MRTIGIYGASDDLVEIEVDGKPHAELGALNKAQSFVITAKEKTLHAAVAHDGKRGWTITTSIDDDTERGDLPFRVELRQRDYSALLLVSSEVPFVVTWWEDGQPQTMTLRERTEGRDGR
jgi:hypothetical protein